MNNLSKVSEIEVYFKPNYKAYERPKISSSKDAYAVLKNNWKEGVIQYADENNFIKQC